MTDRRKNQRIEICNLVSYECIDKNGNPFEQGMGNALNISQGGILLETHYLICSRQIQMWAIDFKDDFVDMNGTIVCQRPRQSGSFLQRVSFCENNGKGCEFLIALVKAYCLQKK